MIDLLHDDTHVDEYDDAEVGAMLHEIDMSVRARLLEDRGKGGPYPGESNVPGFDRASADLDDLARQRGEI